MIFFARYRQFSPRSFRMKLGTVIVLSLALFSCTEPRPQLTLEGRGVALMGSDLVQALPGRPIDKCKIIGHLTTEYTFLCFSSHDLGKKLRNQAGKLGANLVIETSLIDAERLDCYHQARGIALVCDNETLDAAGVNKVFYETPQENADASNEPANSSERVKTRSRLNKE